MADRKPIVFTSCALLGHHLLREQRADVIPPKKSKGGVEYSSPVGLQICFLLGPFVAVAELPS
jgi:hypothetical protein